MRRCAPFILQILAYTHASDRSQVTRDEQYNTPPDQGPEKDQKLRYGNMPNNPEDVSKRDEGPEGASKGGRKAEKAS